MRTTIDLPEDLLRRAKSTAALEGVKLKDLIAQLIDSGLAHRTSATKTMGHELPLPVVITGRNWNIPVRTNAETFELLDRCDEEDRDRPS